MGGRRTTGAMRGAGAQSRRSLSVRLSVCLLQGELVRAFLSDWAESHGGGSGVVSGTFISGTGPIGRGLGKKRAGNLNFSRFHPFFEASFFGRFWMFL